MKVTAHQIESFHSFALEQFEKGGSEWTIDELYDRWRLECPSGEEMQEDVLALKASLRDLEHGETGRPFDEFASDFRARHTIAGRE